MPYGFDDQVWDGMVNVGLTFLERLARNHGDCIYSRFCDEVRAADGQAPEPHSEACSQLLRRIAETSLAERGVVVTALVHFQLDVQIQNVHTQEVRWFELPHPVTVFASTTSNLPTHLWSREFEQQLVHVDTRFRNDP